VRECERARMCVCVCVCMRVCVCVCMRVIESLLCAQALLLRWMTIAAERESARV